MDENSQWIRLFDFCKEEVEKKTIYDFNREVDLTNQCGKIVEQMKFNFVDTRQWFYFFNSLYTKITTYQKDCLKKKKTFTKKEKAHRFDNFRRILRKNLRCLEYCLQDVFVDILHRYLTLAKPRLTSPPFLARRRTSPRLHQTSPCRLIFA